MEISQEELKNMSPEELIELQKKNCIFCHIISGKVQSKKIYEDDKVVAILDINPSNPGHVLLLPKQHNTIMPQVSESDIGHLFMVAKALSQSALKALKSQGTNIFVANGVAAGQKSPHFMIHIIPRKENDDLKVFELKRKKTSKKELEKIQKLLADRFKAESEEKEPIKMDAEPEKIGKEKIVEAEFKEETKKEKKKPKKKKKPVKKAKKPKKTKEEKADLDAIARVLLSK